MKFKKYPAEWEEPISCNDSERYSKGILVVCRICQPEMIILEGINVGTCKIWIIETLFLKMTLGRTNYPFRLVCTWQTATKRNYFPEMVADWNRILDESSARVWQSKRWTVIREHLHQMYMACYHTWKPSSKPHNGYRNLCQDRCLVYQF